VTINSIFEVVTRSKVDSYNND